MVVLFPSCSSNLLCAPCSQVRRSRPKVVQRTTLFMYAQTSNKLVVWKKRVLGIQSTEIENCCCRCLGIKQQQTKHAYTHMHVDTRMNTEMPPPPPPPPQHTQKTHLMIWCLGLVFHEPGIERWRERESTHAYWKTKLIVPSNDVYYYVCLCCQVTLLWRASCTVKHTLDERPSHQDLTWLLFLCTGEQNVEV